MRTPKSTDHKKHVHAGQNRKNKRKALSGHIYGESTGVLRIEG